jgi:uncharacterized membrane protein YhiD involved in acid resistance
VTPRRIAQATRASWWWAAALLWAALVLVVPGRAAPERPQDPSALSPQAPPAAPPAPNAWIEQVMEAVVRLPLAAVLGAALAMRPKRRGTPPRSPAVVETQVMLSVVGALIIIVVGNNLARAFGIVGAANLIRYRSKIDDPKDAVVMLCSLSVGLASGAGIFPLAIFAAGFIVAALWVIESFEPQTVKRFTLRVKLGADTDDLRPRIEQILKRARFHCERRVTSDDELAYDVALPMEADTERVTDAIRQLDPKRQGTVEWDEKKAKGK